MAKLLGIDLGTTFSAMATVDETGSPKIVHNDEGQNITPSCVEINGKDIIVGEEARKGLGVLTNNVVGRFKREMGELKKYEIEIMKESMIDLKEVPLQENKSETIVEEKELDISKEKGSEDKKENKTEEEA